MKDRGKWFVAAAIVLVLGTLGYVSFNDLGDNLVYYWTPSETLKKTAGLQGKDSTIRLGGVVAKDSVQWNAQTLELKFKVADDAQPGAATMLVDSKGAPPQMFREGIGVVVEGKLGADGVFHSDRVLVNHSNEYRPPEHGDAADHHGAGSVQK